MGTNKQFDIPAGSALTSLFNQLFDSMFWIDELGNVLQTDQHSEMQLGTLPEKNNLSHLFEITPLLTLIEWKRYWKELKKEKTLILQTEVMASGHTLIPSTLYLAPCPGDKRIAFVGVSASESVPREKVLQKLLKYQFTAGWWEWDALNQKFKCSEYSADILQIDKTEEIDSAEYLNEILHKRLGEDQFTKFKSAFDLALNKKSGFSMQLTIDEAAYEVRCEVLSSSLRPYLIMGTIQQYQEQEITQSVDQSSAKEQVFSLDDISPGIDVVNTPILILDDNKKPLFANEYAQSLLGLESPSLEGISYQDLFVDDGPLYDSLTQKKIKLKLQAKKVYSFEANIRKWRFMGNTLFVIAGNPEASAIQKENDLKAAEQKIKQLSDRIKEENLFLKQEISANYNFNNIITRSPNYRQVLSQMAQVADTDATVLIMGETGTGKELLARAIHSLSDREEAPLIKINCAALPENLIESELFGHEKGAFTGADQQRKGRFELAHEGSIFLDEIGEMPLGLQSKLLRVLQEGEFERVGGTKTLKTNARVIAATNRDLQRMVEKNTFREDLYYRLNVFPIQNLPLRERTEDIPVLVEHFTRKFNKRFGRNVEKANKADLDRLMQYSFPGNIRELENIVERAIILSPGKKLNLKASFNPPKDGALLKDAENKDMLSFEEMQKMHIIQALEKTKWRITGPQGAARLLKLKDRTLMSKMRKLGIKREDYL